MKETDLGLVFSPQTIKKIKSVVPNSSELNRILSNIILDESLLRNGGKKKYAAELFRILTQGTAPCTHCSAFYPKHENDKKRRGRQR